MLKRDVEFGSLIDISDWEKVQAIMQAKPEWRNFSWERLQGFDQLHKRNNGLIELSHLLVIQRHLVYNQLVEEKGGTRVVCGDDFGALGSDERFYRIMREINLVDTLDFGNAFLNDGLGDFFEGDTQGVKRKPRKEKPRYQEVFRQLWRNGAYMQFMYLSDRQMGFIPHSS
jgi:hypothetical protein